MNVINGDCRDVLARLPAESVHCVVTSPPYWGLRDYGIGQDALGLEPTYQLYVEHIVEVFRAVRRVLREDGTLWLNLGDSYATERNDHDMGGIRSYVKGSHPGKRGWHGGDLKPKNLCGIPWRIAFALQNDGWYLRQDIIWSKPNPMPESVTDRCTKAHEYLFLLSKSARYYFDAEAIKEPVTQSTIDRVSQPTLAQQEGSWRVPGKTNGPMKAVDHGGTRNKRSVWQVATAPFSEAHFATFPPALVEPCIKAGTSERGCCAKCGTPFERVISENPIKTLGWRPTCKCDADVVPPTVLDPFGGAGTTGLVADRLQRNSILIELNPSYVEMARRRVFDDAPLFQQCIEPAY